MPELAIKRKIVICDLDGTLADDTWRGQKYLHGREPKDRDWDGYFSDVSQDLLVLPVAELLDAMSDAGYFIYILSARSDVTIQETQEWLAKYSVHYDYIHLRPADCRIQDTELKIGWAETLNLRDKTLFVLEDRQRMVDAWRAAGYTCFQVNKGNF